MTISIQSEGRRHYIVGNTYAIKDRLRSAGCKWDADRKAWWTGKREIAEQIVSAPAAEQSQAQTSESGERAPDSGREAPGEDAVVAGKATYKGKMYYLAGRRVRGRTAYDDRVEQIATRDRQRVMLYFRDGSKSFWANPGELQVTKVYDRPQTIARLARFAEQRRNGECPACARHCTCGTSFCHHHHDGCDVCGAER